MIVATILTLFFVPFLYAQLDELRSTGSRWLAWVARGSRAQDDRAAG